MLKLSKKVEYALIAMMHMDGLRAGALATTREMSDQYRVPLELLGKVLQALAKARVIGSAPGARGGYRLVRELDRITLGEVVEAIEGPTHLADCQDDPSCCERYAACNIREPVRRVQRRLLRHVYGLPLSVFRKPAAAEEVAR